MSDTLCAWCGKALPGVFVSYQGEIICPQCYERREKVDSYDLWKTTPPDPKESDCKCCECKEDLYPGGIYYEIEGEIFCENCAETWLDCQKREVTEEMAYGEK